MKYICIVLVKLLVVIAVTGCTKNNETIKIGFANTLTGKASTWGVHSRNGAMLAMEEWNKAGGINGQKIEMVYRDDKASSDEALRVDRELMDMGVTAIIGHYLSTICLNVNPLISENKTVMISTAASSTLLAEKDDYLFRLVLSNKEIGASLGYVAYDNLKNKKISIVSDMTNPGYSESFITPFKEAFEEEGGEVVSLVEFSPDTPFSSPDIADEIINSGAEGVCIVTNAIQGALVCQHIKKIKPHIQIYASGWTYSDPNFISNGGKAVEGAISVNEYDGDSKRSDFINYKKRYKKRFGENSTHPDKTGYEAAQIIFRALSENRDPKMLKQTILKIREYKGVDGTLTIDKYGDSVCKQYIREIRDGKIKTLRDYDLKMRNNR